jgi:hypothetical protein
MEIINRRKLPLNELLDLNHATCGDDCFDGYSEAEMRNLVWPEWQQLPQGSPARNYIDRYKTTVGFYLDNVGSLAEKLHTLDKPAERERGRLDTGRLVVQLIQWLRGVQAAQHKPENFWPRFPELYKMRERPLFKVTAPAFQLETWCHDHEDALLDTSRVRVEGPHGVRYLMVRGFDGEDLKTLRSYDRLIAEWIDGQFQRVTRIDGLAHAA